MKQLLSDGASIPFPGKTSGEFASLDSFFSECGSIIYGKFLVLQSSVDR